MTTRRLRRLVGIVFVGVAAGLAPLPAQAAPYYRAGSLNPSPYQLAPLGSFVWALDPTDPHSFDRFDLSELPHSRSIDSLAPDRQISLGSNATLDGVTIASDGSVLVSAVIVGSPPTHVVDRLSAGGALLATYATVGSHVVTGPEGGFYVQVPGTFTWERELGLQRYTATGTPTGSVFAQGINFANAGVVSDGRTVYICESAANLVTMFTATGSPGGTLSVPRVDPCFIGPDGTFDAGSWVYAEGVEHQTLYGFDPTTHERVSEAKVAALVGSSEFPTLLDIAQTGDLLLSGGVYRRDELPPVIDSLETSPSVTNGVVEVSVKASDPEHNLLAELPPEEQWQWGALAEYAVNGGPYQPFICGGSYGGCYWNGIISGEIYLDEPDGSLPIAVRVRDAAGHLSAPVSRSVLLIRQPPISRIKLRWVHGKPRLWITATAKRNPIRMVGLAIVRYRPGVPRRCALWLPRSRAGRWYPEEGLHHCTEPGSHISLENHGTATTRTWVYGKTVRWQNGFDYLVTASAFDSVGNGETEGAQAHFALPRVTHRKR